MGEEIIHIDPQGNETKKRITRIQSYHGIQKTEQDSASCGDIVSLAGIENVLIGDTLCSPEKIIRLPPIKIDEPTLSIDFMVNTSPFVGKDGKHLTMNKIRERLEEEKKANVSLQILFDAEQDKISVSGRGELHLSVLIESMRREGFEMSVSKPKVILKQEGGVQYEPIEKVFIEVPEEFSGSIIEELSTRKGEMLSLHTDEHKNTSMEFLVPTRGLMGWRGNFITKTRGKGILTSQFESFSPWKGEIQSRLRGVLISNAQGKANAYAAFGIQDRGVLFVSPGDEVYEGMIVGEHSRTNDLIVNVVKGKQLTNVRASGSDDLIQLTPPRKFTLEQAIDFIEKDELLEITPHHIRPRKKFLKEVDRKRKS